jgi:DNA-binding transcriptional MerR regulator
VSTDDLLSIGVFSLVSGLSINALRHYDELDLLKPAFVDPNTGYRRYRPGQVRQARMICALRGVDMPIDAVRQALAAPAAAADLGSAAAADLGTGGEASAEALRTLLRRHRERLVDRGNALARMVRVIDRYIEQGVVMPELKTPRIVQVTINVTDLAESVTFYREAFEASYNEEVSSFILGIWPSDEFFMLTVAHGPGQHGTRPGPDGQSRFGLLVDDLDAVHRRALDAGATEVHPPADTPWKPRSSCVADPSGNRIDLYQG